MAEQHFQQKLSFFEKAGYSGADAAANFVFMTMVLFQTNFYTDVFGLTASAAAAILLWPRLWDAVADPIVGILADRTDTRWGKFRPWILATAVPWFIVMILAYTTPHGWSMAAMIAYAAITNTMLMSIYSMNNMPYAALGGVMTGDVNERASLNSFRFIAVNAAQFIVGGFTLTLVAKFAAKHAAGATVGVIDKQYGWQMTMTIWAVLCLVLFLITFATTKERIRPIPTKQAPISDDPIAKEERSRWSFITIGAFLVTALACWASVRFGTTFLLQFTENNYVIQIALWIWRILFVIVFLLPLWKSLPVSVQRDFTDLVKNNPWKVMWCWTLVHFAILSFRGGALYNYYHHYADKAAMFDWVQKLGLVATADAPKSGIMETLGLIVHPIGTDLANSNVADVFNSIINMLGTGLTIIVILLSPSLAKKFGKKAVAAGGFALATVGTLSFYLLSSTNCWGMFAITALVSIAYAPTIPLTWAIFADVADYSELKTGRRFTGMVFATIGFALKSGLALGSASFLWIMVGFFHYDTKLPDTPDAIQGFRVCSGIVVGILFGICTVLLASYQLNKRMTIQMADELAERRRKHASENPVTA
jgi:Na+/melibiose symporter-like transporter